MTKTSTDRTDRIERTILLRVPRARAWKALTDPAEFGAWFGAKLEGRFAPGERVSGHITSPGHEDTPMELMIERVEPEQLLALRWHAYEVDPEDHASAPTTLVEFRLEDVADGTQLTIVESGFDALPPGRRDEAYRSNSEGWSIQVENVRRHVDG